MSLKKQEALDYHSSGRPGKLEVISSKACATQRDLSLAYTPGVAVPCKEIEADPDKVYEYTTKGNLVAVITDGTAVLGLGNIGPLASKPVMEGKGVLFKRFADIDVFDIELNTRDMDKFVETVKMMEPTFGGINLEDIKAPECFYIEKRLIAEMNIPVFHDDQHGTAIIGGAALLNGLEIVQKKIDDAKIVFSGAGAAAIACANHFVLLGAKLENMIMVDSIGVIYKGRTKGMNSYKEKFAIDTDKRTLADAMSGADVFIGVSVKGIVNEDMVRSMADRPLIFAMANPDPEITPEQVAAVRSDAITATGRSDYNNQVNNVLGFPFIFRGALDVRATAINEPMKIAATHALAELAKQDVPDEVLMAYKTKSLSFGANYIIPKPFDARVLYKVAPAVARAAMESGVALKPIADFRAYEEELERRLHPSREMVQWFINQARHDQKMRIVFPEGGHEKILRACRLIIAEGIARPILLGEPDKITERIVALGLDLPEDSYEIIDIEQDTKQLLSYAAEYAKLRSRKGVTIDRARQLLKRRINFGMMMVKMGDADGCVAGVSRSFPDTVRPALQIVGLDANANRACAMHMMLDKKGAFRFFSDTALNVDPNAQDLADITIATTDLLQQLGITPRVAMLSFSNFGSVNNPETQKSAEAVRLVKKLRPNLMIDGEMRVSLATDPQKYFEDYPFCELTSPANVFIFPCLNSGNIGHQLLHYLGGMEVVGPILIGIDKPINALPRDCSLDTIVSVTAITSVMAKRKQALNNK